MVEIPIPRNIPHQLEAVECGWRCLLVCWFVGSCMSGPLVPGAWRLTDSAALVSRSGCSYCSPSCTPTSLSLLFYYSLVVVLHLASRQACARVPIPHPRRPSIKRPAPPGNPPPQLSARHPSSLVMWKLARRCTRRGAASHSFGAPGLGVLLLKTSNSRRKRKNLYRWTRKRLGWIDTNPPLLLARRPLDELTFGPRRDETPTLAHACGFFYGWLESHPMSLSSSLSSSALQPPSRIASAITGAAHATGQTGIKCCDFIFSSRAIVFGFFAEPSVVKCHYASPFPP